MSSSDEYDSNKRRKLKTSYGDGDDEKHYSHQQQKSRKRKFLAPPSPKRSKHYRSDVEQEYDESDDYDEPPREKPIRKHPAPSTSKRIPTTTTRRARKSPVHFDEDAPPSATSKSLVPANSLEMSIDLNAYNEENDDEDVVMLDSFKLKIDYAFLAQLLNKELKGRSLITLNRVSYTLASIVYYVCSLLQWEQDNAWSFSKETCENELDMKSFQEFEPNPRPNATCKYSNFLSAFSLINREVREKRGKMLIYERIQFQEFLTNYSKANVNVTGKMYEDAKKNVRLRLDVVFAASIRKMTVDKKTFDSVQPIGIGQDNFKKMKTCGLGDYSFYFQPSMMQKNVLSKANLNTCIVFSSCADVKLNMESHRATIKTYIYGRFGVKELDEDKAAAAKAPPPSLPPKSDDEDDSTTTTSARKQKDQSMDNVEFSTDEESDDKTTA